MIEAELQRLTPDLTSIEEYKQKVRHAADMLNCAALCTIQTMNCREIVGKATL